MKREEFEARAAEMKRRMLNERNAATEGRSGDERSAGERLVPPIAIERHYRVKDVVELLAFSERTVRRLFDHEPGIVVLPRVRKRGAGAYRSYTIPESVLKRVLNQLTKIV